MTVESPHADGNGDSPAGAWETVEMAAQAWPQDPQLNQARGDYASKSPEFVGILRKAQQAEKEGARGGARYQGRPKVLSGQPSCQGGIEAGIHRSACAGPSEGKTETGRKARRSGEAGLTALV